jgi:hypothetical protein
MAIIIVLKLLQPKYQQSIYIFSLLVGNKIDKGEICQMFCFEKNEAFADI